MRAEHVVVEKGKMYLRFLGKHALPYEVEITNPAHRKFLAKAKTDALLPNGPADVNRDFEGGYDGYLFPWVEDTDLNKYGQQALKLKKVYNLRTRVGCSLAQRMVEQMPAPKTQKEFKLARKAIGVHVSSKLNNTPSIALDAYIDPLIFRSWEDGLED